VMSNAKIAQIGTPRELYEEPSSLFVADFIGDANLIDAEVIEERGERALVRLGPLEVELARRGARKGPVKVAVRPDAVTIGAAPDRAGPANGAAVAATVVKGSYLGRHIEYTLATPLGELFVVDRRTRAPLPAGTAVTIGFSEVTVVPP